MSKIIQFYFKYMYFITFIITLILGYILFNTKLSSWIKIKYQQFNTIRSLINNIQIQNENKKSGFETSESDKCAIIRYDIMGKQYTIYTQYNRSKVSQMSSIYVACHYNNGQKEFDITQQPGIPYTITPNLLEVDYIKAIELNSGKTHIYRGDTSPMYCDEVMFSE